MKITTRKVPYARSGLVCAVAALLLAGAVPASPARADSRSVAAEASVPVGAPAARPNDDVRPARAAPRPRIGLVLGGGGAKGAAHVGVLSVLEELHVPVDCVVGTSVGALVGGTYASGADAAEIEEAIGAIPWENTIAFQGQRVKAPVRRKLGAVTYSNNLEFGIGRQGVATPTSIINTQYIDQTIQQLVSRSHGEQDFDRLAIPFRAIATDMQTGDMVVLHSGNLAQAMRASMAVPGVFSPVTIDGRILGDGGLSRNVAVDVARATCADVVIAVALSEPVPTPEELLSPLNMVRRTIDVLIMANEKQQLETLTPADVKIVIDTGAVGPTSFDKVGDAIPLGREAALEQRAALARYALPQAEYRAWRGSVSRPEHGPVRLAGVEVTGQKRVNPDYVRDVVGLEAGEVVDEQQISEHVDRLYALSDFETVRYALIGERDQPVLELDLQEKSTGPNALRFDVGLYMGTDANTAFTIAGNYLRTWINPAGGEINASMRLGRTSGLDAWLYQPLDPQHRWFVEPGIRLQRSLEDFYIDGNAVARYDLRHAYGFADAGRTFGATGELRAGLRFGAQWADRNIASPEFPAHLEDRYGGLALRYVYDSRDHIALARHGVLAGFTYFDSDERLGGEFDYRRLEAMATLALPVGGDVAYLRGSGGTSLGTDLPVYDQFVLGGPISMPGLNLGELRGQSYWSAKAGYLRKIADISALFGQSVYLGFALTVAEMQDRLDEVAADPIYSGEVLLGGRTPLGPVTLSLSAATEGGWQLVFGLGRPIEEGAITDPSW
jgi:NTE family protein